MNREGISLVKDGVGLGTIVIADKFPDPPVRFAAEELKRYIFEMSDVILPVRRGAARGPSVVISSAGKAGPKVTSGALPSDEEDAYCLKSVGRNLYLSGASPRAALYAVYTFLEKLGCGFCVPGEDTVPRKRSITAPHLNMLEVPAFEFRSHIDNPFRDPFPIEGNVAVIDWLAKNRFNWYHPVTNCTGEPEFYYRHRELISSQLAKRGLCLQVGGHTMQTWLPENKYFASHPEYYSLVDEDGEGAESVRKAPSACISSPGGRRTVIRNICNFLDRCPEVDAVDIWDADMVCYCHCSKCLQGVTTSRMDGWRKRGQLIGAYAETLEEEILRSAYTSSFIGFLNAVARGVKKKHPNVVISSAIYGQTGVPSLYSCEKLENNVALEVAHLPRDSFVPLAGEPRSELNRRWIATDLTWMEKGDRVGVYEYYHSWTGSVVYPQVNVIAEDLRFLHQIGVRRIVTDQGGWSPTNIYAAARLLWNPNKPWHDLIKDFCRRYYGRAAAKMEKYWLNLEDGMRGKEGFFGELAPIFGGQPYEGHRESRSWLLSKRKHFVKRLKAILQVTKDPVTKRRLER